MATDVKSTIDNQNNDASTKKTMQIDDVFNKIKPFGRYQLLITFVYAYAYFPLMINTLFMGYGGMKPKWICNDDFNSSSLATVTQSCVVYHECAPENLTFVSDFYSIGIEWSLICDRAYFISLITSIQMIGLMAGAVTIGPIADFYGRKWIFFTVLALELSVGALSGVSTNATTFAVFRFCIGFCTGAEVVVGWVFTAETTTNRYRFLILVVSSLFLPSWNQVFVAYVTKHWLWYSVVGNLEALPLLIIIAFFTHESPRWLLQKGRSREAHLVLSKIARFNKTSHLLPEAIELETSGSKDERRKTYHMLHLFKSKRLAVYTLASIGTWFSISLVHYGMFFDIGNLPTNVYVNGVMLAAVGMAVVPVAVYDAYNTNVNRKYMLVIFFLIAFVCNVAIVLFKTAIASGDVNRFLTSFCSIVGIAATEACLNVAYVYAIELFPTLLRSNACALSSMGGRIGGIIAPQLLFASRTWAALPYVCFAVISALGAGVDSLVLPNTKNMQLPETYEQSNRESKDNKAFERKENDVKF